MLETAGGGARDVDAHGDDLLPQQVAADVDLVDRGVVDHVAGRVALGDRGVAVAAVDQGGVAELAALAQGRHLLVALVETPHEPDGDESFAGLRLGFHDGDAVLGGGGQGLLAQDVLAGFDSGDDVGGVDLAEGGDQDRVHVGVGDQFGARGVRLRAERPGHGLRPFDVEVGDGDDLAAGEFLLDALHVGAAHAAGADEPDAYSHGVSPLRGCVSGGLRWVLVARGWWCGEPQARPRPHSARYLRMLMAFCLGNEGSQG